MMRNNIKLSDYSKVEHILSQFKAYYHTLEKNDFYEDDQLRDGIEDILLKIYSLEGHLKKRAYKNSAPNSDKALQRTASKISLNALSTASLLRQYKPLK